MKKLVAILSFVFISVMLNAQCIVQIQPSGVLCFGDCNGQATAYANGVSPITYLWSPGGQTTPTATNLCIGTYTVLITDATGCTATATTVITQPAPLQAIITSFQNESCVGCCDGFATGTASGGTPAYTYTWYPTSQWGPTGQQLCGGTHTFCATDMNGCTTCDSVYIATPNSVPDEMSVARVKIFPNPGQDEISFMSEPQSEWVIINSLGEPVMTGSSETGMARVNISSLPAGVYSLKISQIGAFSAGQFVKFDE